MRTREQRFWEKVGGESCRIWLGARNSWGYGTFAWGHNKNINASRAAWLLQRGEIPEGLDVLHTCNNRLCVNVEHMYLGTDKDNAADRKRLGTHTYGERNSHAQLTEAQVREILKRNTGKRGDGAKLAREYGVSNAIVGNILRGDTWKHIPR